MCLYIMILSIWHMNKNNKTMYTIEQAKKIQAGNLVYRRWSKLVILATIGFNIWLDKIVGYLLTNIENVLSSAESISKHWSVQWTVGLFHDPTPDVAFMQKIMLIFIVFSTVSTILLWWQTWKALKFVIADCIVENLDSKRVITIWMVLSVINLVTLGVLTMFWWP